MARQTFLALFAYAGVTPQTHDCLLRDLPGFRPVTYHRESKDALISRSRSFAASVFLRSECDVMVMIDHDISWQPGDLQRLVDSCLKTGSLVGGVYPKRAFGEGLACKFLQNGRYAIGSDTLVPAEYLSTGFFAAHRSVMEAVAQTLPLTSHDFWPLFLPMLSPPRANGRPEYLSEDWSFCERARNLGFPMYLDLQPRLTHAGVHVYRVVDTGLKLPEDMAVTVNLQG